MTDYGMSIELPTGIAEARERVEAALAEQGFGVLTEIDVAATLKNKIGKDIPPQLILGACNPVLADRALTAETSIGLLLPCNVVLRSTGEHRTIVEALDPAVMVTITGNTDLEPVATEARAKLTAALETLSRATDQGPQDAGLPVGSHETPPQSPSRVRCSRAQRRGDLGPCSPAATRRTLGSRQRLRPPNTD